MAVSGRAWGGVRILKQSYLFQEPGNSLSVLERVVLFGDSQQFFYVLYPVLDGIGDTRLFKRIQQIVLVVGFSDDVLNKLGKLYGLFGIQVFEQFGQFFKAGTLP